MSSSAISDTVLPASSRDYRQAGNFSYWQKTRKAWLSLFVGTYFLGTILWLWPDCRPKQLLLRPVKPVWNFLGFWQGWNLFSPKLRDITFNTTANVTFADGSTVLWEVPQMNKLSYWERFQKEKWRKWGSDTMPWPDFSEMWPATARYIARLYANPNNPPAQVALTLHWAPIPPPEAFVKQKDLPEHTNPYCIFVYRVRPEDLEK